MADDRLTTANLHADRHFGVEHGGIHKPIHTSVQYGFERAEDLIGVFQGTVKGGYNYARQGTPTSSALEAKVTALEQGTGSICFATGMAAITASLLTLLRAGEHMVSSRYVFGNTNSLWGTLRDLGIGISMVDTCSVDAVAAAIRPETRVVFVEVIANPRTQVPDLEAIGALCQQRGLLFMVDNTVTSPALFQPRTVGAGLVINSLTKTLAGHGAALGGAVTDTGLFDWSRWPNIFESYRKGDPSGWGLQQIRKKGLRDMGAPLAPEAAHQISVGSETLALRVERTSTTALLLAQHLQTHPAVAAVYYPGLPSHPQHALAQRLFRAHSWLLSFEIKQADRMVQMLNRLRLPIKATGLGDTRSLVIPVAHTIFWEAGAQARAQMGIADGLVRYSVGLEDPQDLLADLDQALSGL